MNGQKTTKRSSRVSTARARSGRVWEAFFQPSAAVLLALVLGAAILWISGSSPWQAYSALLEGSFGSWKALARTLEKATPLIFSGLAVTFALKANLFNIGVQGQLLVGAIVSAVLGYQVRGLPAAVHLPLALLGGAAAGALYGAIPGLLKSYTGAHEVITTIMLNYIAINLTDYLADGPLKDLSPGNIVARTPLVADTARLPDIGSIPTGVILSILAAVLVWWLLVHTTTGFDICTTGINSHAAQYAGISIRAMVIVAMMGSGFLAGLGGAVETLGVVGRYQPGFNAGLGLEGITVALLGRLNPFGALPAALLIGAMKAGSSQMQFSAGTPKEITDVIQALILFFVAAEGLLKMVLHKRQPKQHPEMTATLSRT